MPRHLQHEGGPVTRFVISDTRDVDAMNRLGLGGAAVAGGRMFTGAMALDLATIKRLDSVETAADEAEFCLRSVESNLAMAGFTMDDIVKITNYVSESQYVDEVLDVLDAAFAHRTPPKRITLVCGIAGECRVELEVMAYRADGGTVEISTAQGRSVAKQFIKPNTAGPSAGVITDKFVFTAASAIDPATMKRVPEAVTVKDEIAVILGRIEAVLAEDGLTLRDLTKLTAWVSQEQYRLDFAYAYAELMAPGPFPSRALFAIGLPGDCRVQLDVIAARRDPAGKES